MSRTSELIRLALSSDIKKARELVLSDSDLIHKNHKDSNDNSIMHSIFSGFILKLKKLNDACQKYHDFQYNSDINKKKMIDETEKATEELTSQFYKIIDELFNLRFPYLNKNKYGQMPIHFLQKVRGKLKWCKPDVESIEREIIKYEQEGNILLSGRKYVSNFLLTKIVDDKTRTKRTIPDCDSMLDLTDKSGLSLHQRFEILEQYYQTNILSAPNLVFANIGFMVIETESELETFVTFPVSDKNKITMKIEGQFIHSEKALYQYLCSENVLNTFVDQLEEKLNKKIRKYQLLL